MSQTFASNDFNDIMESLTLFMRNQNEFKDMNFDGSAIREILRVLAYNAQQQAFQNNFLYNELQFDTAQIRANITSLASRLGYVPSSKSAARMMVNLTVIPSDISSANASLVLTKDVQFYANKDLETFVMSPDTEYSAALINGKYSFPNVTLLQGIWALNGFVITNELGNSSYVIPNSSIDSKTIQVAVRTSETSGVQTSFNRFESAYDLNPTSNLFYLRENRDALYEIKFGDNKFSKRLSNGNVVTVRYLVTKGDLGNNLSTISPASSIGGYYDIRIDYIDNMTYGGSDQEDIESIRALAPITFAASGKAVTSSDYAGLTKRIFPETQDCISWGGEDNQPPKYGYVFVSIVPKNSEYLSISQKAFLVKEMNRYNVGSITPVVVDPVYTYVNIDTKIKFKPTSLNTSTDALRSKVVDYCRIFSRQKMEKFSGTLDTSILSEFINNIDPSIKGNSTLISYEKRFTPMINVASSYLLDFSHILKEGTVNITGFTIPDIDSTGYTYSLKDKAGILSLIKTKTDGMIIVISDNSGIVNYTTGIVRVDNFKPSSITNAYIVVKASSDVIDDQSLIAVRNSILKVNVVNVNLIAVEQ